MDHLLQFFAQGGPFMFVIGAVLFAAIAVIVERTYFYQVVCRVDANGLVDATTQAVERGQARKALGTLQEGRSPLHALAATAVAGHLDGFPSSRIEEDVEEVSVQEVARLHRRVDYLSMLANVATLAGLLGTIFGLKESFLSLSAADPSTKATLLAAGISQAMNTTAMGLIVAIPCMVAHAKLTARRNQLLTDLDASVLRLLGRLRAHPGHGPALIEGGRQLRTREEDAPQARPFLGSPLGSTETPQ
ncbi:MAG: MotA/TolQ/ExbB proton channel family protein [Candidatus Eisenbacteria bacterium]